MAEQIQETRERVVNNGDSGQAVRRVTTTTTNEPVVAERTVARDNDAPNTAARVVWFITGLIITLLAFRFVLSLLGANRANAFADLVYSVTYPFVAPFLGLFGYQVRYGVSRFEIEALVAMAVYALLGYGIARLLTINRRNRDI